MIYIENLMLVLSTSMAATFILIGGILAVIKIRKKKDRHLFLYSISWLFQSIFWYLVSSAHLTYSTTLMSVAFIPQSIGVPFMIVFIELIGRESVSSWRISLLAIIETMFLIILFLPGAMEVIPGYGVHFIGISRLLQILWLAFYVFYYFSWSYRTWRKAPPQLKKNANLLLIGSIMFSFLTLLMYAMGTFLKLLNPIGFIIHGLGALLTLYVFRRDLKIIYILPFKAYKLMVFEKSEGISLFKHDWAELRDVEENIFAMLLQATRSVLNEIINKGEVRKIDMDKAILLIQHDVEFPIISMLVSSESSKLLRSGLKKFHNEFISEFWKEGLDFHDTENYKGAIKLVNAVFDFVPNYIKKS
jgi:hypothetical protein